MDIINTHALEHLLVTYGYLAVLLVITVESMGIPLPGETMLMIASVYAGTTNNLRIDLVVLAAVGGAVLGDNLGFLIGRQGGQRLLRRYGRYVRVDENRLRLGRYLFDRHGGKVVFFGRFVPVLRMWAAFLAGSNDMSWRRFLAFNAAGAATWATTMGVAAYIFGNSIAHLGGTIGLATGVVATGLMALTVVLIHRGEQRLQNDVEDTGTGAWAA